jgi:hypothetical protein
MGSLVLVLATCLAGPPLVVGLAAAGVPWQVSSAVVASTGIVVLWRTALQARAIGYQRLHWPAVIAVVTVLGAATIATVRLSHFMLDHTRADLSVLPNRAFFRAHSCLSAYTEAARLAPTGVNIFAVAQYTDPQRPGQNQPRFIGPFEVDLYQYPPAFLVLPRAAVATGLGFLTTRQVWFALQSLVLMAAMVILARWIGGASGLLVLLLVPIVWLAPTTRLAAGTVGARGISYPRRRHACPAQAEVASLRLPRAQSVDRPRSSRRGRPANAPFRSQPARALQLL